MTSCRAAAGDNQLCTTIQYLRRGKLQYPQFAIEMSVHGWITHAAKKVPNFLSGCRLPMLVTEARNSMGYLSIFGWTKMISGKRASHSVFVMAILLDDT